MLDITQILQYPHLKVVAIGKHAAANAPKRAKAAGTADAKLDLLNR
jgi:hypothetical protein